MILTPDDFSFDRYLAGDYGGVAIINSDVTEGLKLLPDESVQCVVTSPPYWGLRDYGVAGQIGLEPTPDAYVAKMVEVFREVRRTMRKDGTCWINLGDSYNSPGPNNHDKSDIIGTTKLGGQPSTRRIASLKPKDLVGIPWRVAFALQTDGWWLRSDIIWAKPNPMPESVTDRPTKSHEYIFLMTKSARYYYDAEAIAEPAALSSIERWSQPNIDSQSGSDRVPGKTNGKMKAVGGPRSFKGSQFNTGKTAIHQLGRSSEKPRIHGNLPGRDDGGAACNKPDQEYRNKRSVWTVATQPFKEAHFATFPEDLIKPCILAGSRKGDITLDPFGGAMTTALVAKELSRQAICIELKEEYCRMGEQRLTQEVLSL